MFRLPSDLVETSLAQWWWVCEVTSYFDFWRFFFSFERKNSCNFTFISALGIVFSLIIRVFSFWHQLKFFSRCTTDYICSDFILLQVSGKNRLSSSRGKSSSCFTEIFVTKKWTVSGNQWRRIFGTRCTKNNLPGQDWQVREFNRSHPTPQKWFRKPISRLTYSWVPLCGDPARYVKRPAFSSLRRGPVSVRFVAL